MYRDKIYTSPEGKDYTFDQLPEEMKQSIISANSATTEVNPVLLEKTYTSPEGKTFTFEELPAEIKSKLIADNPVKPVEAEEVIETEPKSFVGSLTSFLNKEIEPTAFDNAVVDTVKSQVTEPFMEGEKEGRMLRHFQIALDSTDEAEKAANLEEARKLQAELKGSSTPSFSVTDLSTYLPNISRGFIPFVSKVTDPGRISTAGLYGEAVDAGFDPNDPNLLARVNAERGQMAVRDGIDLISMFPAFRGVKAIALGSGVGAIGSGVEEEARGEILNYSDEDKKQAVADATIGGGLYGALFSGIPEVPAVGREISGVLSESPLTVSGRMEKSYSEVEPLLKKSVEDLTPEELAKVEKYKNNIEVLAESGEAPVYPTAEQTFAFGVEKPSVVLRAKKKLSKTPLGKVIDEPAYNFRQEQNKLIEDLKNDPELSALAEDIAGIDIKEASGSYHGEISKQAQALEQLIEERGLKAPKYKNYVKRLKEFAHTARNLNVASMEKQYVPVNPISAGSRGAVAGALTGLMSGTPTTSAVTGAVTGAGGAAIGNRLAKSRTAKIQEISDRIKNLKADTKGTGPKARAAKKEINALTETLKELMKQSVQQKSEYNEMYFGS